MDFNINFYKFAMVNHFLSFNNQLPIIFCDSSDPIKENNKLIPNHGINFSILNTTFKNNNFICLEKAGFLLNLIIKEHYQSQINHKEVLIIQKEQTPTKKIENYDSIQI